MCTIMICEYNQQSDLCWLNDGAAEWPGPDDPRGFGDDEYRYPSIHSNITVIIPEEYYVYIYDLWI